MRRIECIKNFKDSEFIEFLEATHLGDYPIEVITGKMTMMEWMNAEVSKHELEEYKKRMFGGK